MAKRKLLGRITGYPRILGDALQSLNHINTLTYSYSNRITKIKRNNQIEAK